LIFQNKLFIELSSTLSFSSESFFSSELAFGSSLDIVKGSKTDSQFVIGDSIIILSSWFIFVSHETIGASFSIQSVLSGSKEIILLLFKFKSCEITGSSQKVEEMLSDSIIKSSF
jgi:hypothetical protein